jgi:hypothetical protein
MKASTYSTGCFSPLSTGKFPYKKRKFSKKIVPENVLVK